MSSKLTSKPNIILGEETKIVKSTIKNTNTTALSGADFINPSQLETAAAGSTENTTAATTATAGGADFINPSEETTAAAGDSSHHITSAGTKKILCKKLNH